MSQKVLAKPFKSPSRMPPAAKSDAVASTEASTPTQTTRKRPALSSVPPAARKLDLGTPPSSNKRPRISQTTAASSKKIRRLSARGLPPRFVYRDEGTLALVQEKNSLQRQVAETKEEAALLKRALTLGAKKEAEVVDGLISKWQAACSLASEELFALLKPMMEAQRLSGQMGFGGNPFASDSTQQPKSNTDEEDEDIDIAYMLKRFGIDPELFDV
ncbi:hypothetical protein IWW37_005902 [Coemansia sp. RSA 2050]|nr:hypothetical protein IWW37_005902 [Coemansia sp. RSA 2050]KAJ2728641.1 hypothetical protein IW152_005907 [Coemansia sp. BCRC 34962]